MRWLLSLIIYILQILIFIRVILSWVIPYERNEFVRLVNDITEPILKPFRIIIPIAGNAGIDISPIVVLLLLHVLSNFI